MRRENNGSRVLANGRSGILPSLSVGGRGRPQRGAPEATCCVCERGGGGVDSLIRVQIGRIRYGEDGDEFHQESFPDGARSKWAHGSCAYDSVKELIRWDWCKLCNCQFAQDVPGTALLLERGAFHAGKLVKRFVTEEAGAFHWACAKEHWDPDLFEALWRVNGDTKKDRRRYLPSVQG